MVYPLVVLVVSAAFAVAVARQYAQRHRPYRLAWLLSLLTATGGSLAYVMFLGAGKSELAFRLYYVFGALLTAPLLGLGSLLLVSRTPAARFRSRVIVCGVAVASVIGAVLLLVQPIHTDILQRLNGGPGTNPDVYTPGLWTVFVIVLNSFGGLAVVGVAIYSGVQLWRRMGTSGLLIANVLIALGTLIISQAGTMARTGFGAGLFWLTMAVGWVVLYAGFLVTFNAPHGAAAPLSSSHAVAHT